MTTKSKDLTARYGLQQVLNWTATSRTFRGALPSTGEAVAVKVISFGHVVDRNSVGSHFRLAARTLQTIDHEFLPKLVESGLTADSDGFLVFEWVDASPLIETGRLEPLTVIPAMIQVIEALECLALHGLVHLNVRPENVLRRSDGSVLLVGFGTALTALYGGKGTVSSVSSGEFAAPEAKSVSASDSALWKADLYSLAMMTCRLLGVSVEGAGSSGPQISMPASLAGDLHDAATLRRILERCLHLDPLERPASLSQVRKALQQALKRSASGQRSYSPARQSVDEPLLSEDSNEFDDLRDELAGNLRELDFGVVPGGNQEEESIFLKLPSEAASADDSSGARSPSAGNPSDFAEATHFLSDLDEARAAAEEIDRLSREGDFDSKPSSTAGLESTQPLPSLGQSPQEPPPGLPARGRAVPGRSVHETRLAPEIHAPGVRFVDKPKVAKSTEVEDESPRRETAEVETFPARRKGDAKRDAGATDEGPQADPDSRRSVRSTQLMPPLAQRSVTLERRGGVAQRVPAAEVPHPPAANSASASPPSPLQQPPVQQPPVHQSPVPQPPGQVLSAVDSGTTEIWDDPLPIAKTPPSLDVIRAQPQPKKISWTERVDRRYLIAGGAVILLLVVAVLAWPKGDQQQETEVPVLTATPAPEPVEPPPVAPPQPTLPSELLTAIDRMADDDLLGARDALQALVERGEQERLGADVCEALLSTTEVVSRLRIERVATDLVRHLSRGRSEELRRTLQSLSQDEESLLQSAGRFGSVIDRSRLALTGFDRFEVAMSESDSVAALEEAFSLQESVPEFVAALKLTDRAAAALEEDVDRFIVQSRFDEARRRVEVLARLWPDRPGLHGRQEVLSGRRETRDTFQALLQAAAAAANDGKPHRGLEMLAGARAPASLQADLESLRSRLERQLADLDAQAPQIRFVEDEVEFKKGQPLVLHFETQDDYGVAEAMVAVRTAGSADFESLKPRLVGEGNYQVEIPAAQHNGKPVELWGQVTDLSGHVGTLASAEAPISLKRKRWFR